MEVNLKTFSEVAYLICRTIKVVWTTIIQLNDQIKTHKNFLL